MSSVPLTDLPRTTSFRLGLLFLGLFGAASLIVFGFIYWQTAGYLTSGVDDWLHRELAGRATAMPAERARLLDERALRDPEGRRPFALFDPDGRWLAGSPARLPSPLPPIDRPFDFTLERGDETAPFRGMAHRLESGEILLMAQDMRQIWEFREILLGAMVWGGVLVVVLGLAGATVTGLGALRRIDGVTRAIERIVGGNLGERLPTRGAAGDLDRLIHVVNRMLSDIERLMREVKSATDSIAHDLRTPLTRLLAGLERTQRRAASIEEYGAAVDTAILETKGILGTFNAMLRISEVEDGARRAGFTTVDLATIARDVTELYEPVAEAKGVSLALDAAGPVEMQGDRSLLFEAIGNVVDNAVKFTPDGGRVTVRAVRRRARVEICVTDTGPGIAIAEREAVLRHFYRAEKSRHTPGTGLGLSLTAAVARLHGIDLAIDDAQPGCRVTLSRHAPTTLRHSVTESNHPVPAAAPRNSRSTSAGITGTSSIR
jgi:signal transduction histidine kinase